MTPLGRDSLYQSSTRFAIDSKGRVSELLASIHDDDELAYVIGVAARKGEWVVQNLDEAKAVIPRFSARSVVVDAVVDLLIRAGVRGGLTAEQVGKQLAARHPDLADGISRATALSALLNTAPGLLDEHATRNRSLPEEIGPLTPEGRSRYTVREHLAAGTHGSVYLAVDHLLSRPGEPAYVAVKFLHARQTTAIEQREMAEEAYKARRVSHQNVARVTDRGVANDGCPYVVSEFVDGMSLLEWTRTQRRETRLVVQVIHGIAQGLEAIHSANLLHCDLKPANIVMDRAGFPKITDFGLARSRVGPQGAPDWAGGTLGFGAPEHLRGVAPSTTASDVYALGGVLLWCLTGIAPNGMTAEEAHAALQGGAVGADADRVANPSALNRIDDSILRQICERALQLDPSRRYTSATAFASDISRWLQHEPIAWVREPQHRKLMRWLRREKFAAGAFMTALLTVLVSTVWYARSSKSLTEAERREHIAMLQFNEGRKAFLSVVELARRNKSRMSDPDWLRDMLVIDGLFESRFTADTGDEMEALWADRIGVAERAARAYRDSLGQHTVPSAQWLQLQGTWMLRAGKSQDAVSVLHECVEAWKLAAPNDPMSIDFAERLLAVAVMRSTPHDSGLSQHIMSLENARNILARPPTVLVEKADRHIRELLGYT